ETNRERGTTVLLTTHDLDDVEQLCKRMLIIDHGEVLLDSQVETFKAEHGTERTVVVDLDLIEFSTEPPDASTTSSSPLLLTTGRVIRSEGLRHWVRFDRRNNTAAEVIAEITAAHAVRDLAIEEPDIEDLIRRIYAIRSGEQR
ncbi:MAG: methionine ABC transporter ATP-binding protein, partial [Acidimicrobiales bacterium]